MGFFRKLLRLLTAPEKERAEIQEVRLRLLGKLMKVTVSLGFLAVLLGSLRAVLQGRWIYACCYVVVYCTLLAVTLANGHFPLRLKSMLLVGSLLIVSLTSFAQAGLGGPGMQIIIAGCFLSAVFLGVRAGFLMLAVGMAAVLAIAAAFLLGLIPIHPDFFLTSASALSWSTAIACFAMLTTGLILAPQIFISRLQDSLELLEKRGRALKRSNTTLKEQVRTRRKAEKALSDAFDIINRSPAVAFLWKNEEGWPVEFVSENVKELFGYSAEEFMSGKILYADTIFPEDLPRLIDELKCFFRQESVERFTVPPYRILTRDGRVKWVQDRTFVRRDEKGRVTHQQGIVEDITERKKAEQALQESSSQFRLIFQTVPDAVSIVRMRDGICLDVNDQFVLETGWRREEVIGKKFKDLGMWCNARDQEKMVELLTRSGRVHNLESVFRMKNGAMITALLSAVTFTIGGEQVIVTITRDITERERSKQALKESEKKYRLVVDNANEWMVLTQNRKIVFANRASIVQSGYSQEELSRHDLADFIHPEDREMAMARYAGKMSGQEFRGDLEFRLLCKDGKVIWVKISSCPVTWMGEPALLNFMNDISRQKEAEAEKEKLQAHLQRAQKMEAIGTLAGGVAHDLNNILSGIVSYPDLLLMQLPENSPLRKPVTTIRESGKRAAAVVQDLLTLARRGLVVTELVDLNEMIREFLGSAEFEKLCSNYPLVKIETHLEKSLMNLTGSPVHLQKTIMNLVLNAFEAMPGGGAVTIATENRRVKGSLNGYDHVHEGEYVMLSVSDTGVGISPEDRERIFEPFYTKKAMGRSGTGLGMAVVWGTIKDHKGYIDVESTLGRGTVFMLYFPASPLSAKRASPVPVDYQGKGETILIIDDMEDQREIATTLLSRLGYSVTSVSSGEEAVRRLDKEPVDLLVLDMIMGGGMDGLDTYRQVIEICPSQKAILASGYSETARVREAQRLGAGQYIRKPYTLERIGIAVRGELDRREPIAA